MENKDGIEINLCPNKKENCIFNKEHYINKPEKCYECKENLSLKEQIEKITTN